MAKKKRNHNTTKPNDENIIESTNNIDNSSSNNDSSDIDIDLNTDFDSLYSSEKTKEIVGSLFDEYVGESGTNYFADLSNTFLEEPNEDTETLEESIARKRKRAVTPTKKSIVIRKKAKKSSDAKDEADENYDENADALFDEENEDSNPLDKTIILPKLSNFFKKADKEENEENDIDNADDGEDVDEFFAWLKKDSVARVQSAATKEVQDTRSDNEDKHYDEEEKTVEPSKTVAEPSKPREIHKRNRTSEQPRQPEKKPAPKKPIQEEDFEDEEIEQVIEIGIAKIVLCSLLVISVCVITALAYKNHSYSKQLEEARNQITELQKSSSSTYETELEELKNQVSELTAENESLKAESGAANDPHTVAVEILSEAQNEISTAATADSNLSQQESSGNTYTIKKGDTFWTISQSVYGDGSKYQKILDANGLNENSILNEGQTLKIPN